VSFEDLVDGTTEAHERRIRRCKSCQARIIFLPTSGGTPMPVDADTVEHDDELFNAARHVSHFATCSDPAAHRKPR
jgi:hypothetical protein